ncbi:MAG TPA: hypothetical protein DD723_05530 [Candidatus Omnitrophica bacterium]|nr:MAG: hypothetical protein A2Z81_05520 [Omnitrophica WOR_2 bacterium GWA2_45_18]HBR14988.1 hypothetical protein [Candidatus Omnitrophota bacterium]
MWIVSLIKFGKQEHIEQLYNKGIIYMNPLKFFRELEEDQVRGDPNEGTTRISQPEIIRQVKLISGGKEIVLENKGLIKEANVSGNIFCALAIFRKEDQSVIKPDIRGDVFKFGDAILLINNVPEFIDRVTKAAQKVRQNMESRAVKYIDFDKHHGQVEWFEKDKKYSYQNEFRFFVFPGVDQTLQLRIGPLKNLAVRINKRDLVSLKFDFSG